MIMGRDSCSEGRGFESRHRILDGHFFTYNCCKNCNVCLKRPKINEREAGVGPFLKRLYLCRMVAMTRHKSNEMFIPSSEMFVLIGV